jgi:hypothetical protein
MLRGLLGATFSGQAASSSHDGQRYRDARSTGTLSTVNMAAKARLHQRRPLGIPTTMSPIKPKPFQRSRVLAPTLRQRRFHTLRRPLRQGRLPMHPRTLHQRSLDTLAPRTSLSPWTSTRARSHNHHRVTTSQDFALLRLQHWLRQLLIPAQPPDPWDLDIVLSPALPASLPLLSIPAFHQPAHWVEVVSRVVVSSNYAGTEQQTEQQRPRRSRRWSGQLCAR